MRKVVTSAAFEEPDASYESSPVKMEATAPNPAGMKTQTSFSEMLVNLLRVECNPQAVSCSPG